MPSAGLQNPRCLAAGGLGSQTVAPADFGRTWPHASACASMGNPSCDCADQAELHESRGSAGPGCLYCVPCGPHPLSLPEELWAKGLPGSLAPSHLSAVLVSGFSVGVRGQTPQASSKPLPAWRGTSSGLGWEELGAKPFRAERDEHSAAHARTREGRAHSPRPCCGPFCLLWVPPATFH